jgi:hypothetical protein
MPGQATPGQVISWLYVNPLRPKFNLKWSLAAFCLMLKRHVVILSSFGGFFHHGNMTQFTVDRANSRPMSKLMVPKKTIGRILAWIVFFLATTGLWEPATAQEIWFVPPDNLPRGTKLMNEDFDSLWNDPQSWPFAASHTAVFSINPYYAAVTPAEKIQNINQFLSAHHIGLAVGMQSLPVEGCGLGIEGTTKAGAPGVIARRLKRFGADIQYFALDEPLEFGSIYKGANACKYPVQEVARRLADTIRDLRATYPNAKIVEYEPPNNQPLTEWTQTLAEYLDAYRQQTGTPLDELVLDTGLAKPWRETAKQSIAILHQHGTKAGIFLDAHGGPGVTDQSWMGEALEYARQIHDAKLNLDSVVISSWMLHPWRNTPESDPLTLAALVGYYARLNAKPN